VSLAKPNDFKPTEAELRRLYLVEQRSVTYLMKLYRVQHGKVAAWLESINVPIRSKAEQHRLWVDQIRVDNSIERTPEVIQGEYQVNDSSGVDDVNEPKASLNSTGPQLGLQAEIYETAYMRLTPTQQQCVELMTELGHGVVNKDIADKTGISLATLTKYKRLPDFQRALDEAQRPFFLAELKTLSRADLLNRYRTGKTTDNDRERAFRLTGDLGPDAVATANVRVHIKGGSLF